MLKNSMDKSLEQLKYIERISRQTRHHRIHLNQIYDEKLRQNLENLTDQYQQTFLRLKTDRKLEQKRKQILNVTVQQIANERERYHSAQINKNRSLNSNQLHRESCCLFSHNCQLYPCQPVYHYTSFIKKEHDQTLCERNPSDTSLDPISNSSHFQKLLTNIQEKKYQQNRRQLAITVHNQHHLANRHVSMTRTMAHLNEQSRLLHERLADKRKFAYIKEDQIRITTSDSTSSENFCKILFIKNLNIFKFNFI